MTWNPFFSVVIPTYNRSGLLIHTIDAILKQSFNDYEIIIVDDGSTDNTVEVIQPILKNEKRILLLNQENKERGAARNHGLLKAKGTYVVFFDSDDLMHDNHLNVLHQNILEQNFPFFIATKFDFINEKEKHFPSDICKLSQGYYNYNLFLNGNPLACNICVKKANPDLFLFEEDRRFSIKEDWMFMLQNFQQNKLFIIDQITISMLDHSDRSMRSDNKEIIKRTLSACEWILLKINLNTKELNKLKAHVYYFCGIHSYLDNNIEAVFNFVIKAIKFGGFKMKYISLLLKSIVGRKILSKLNEK